VGSLSGAYGELPTADWPLVLTLLLLIKIYKVIIHLPLFIPTFFHKLFG
jgi:hypothetical protein